MKLCFGIFIVFGAITHSEQQSCKVLTECENNGIDWRRLSYVAKEQEGEPAFTVKETGPKLHYIANTMTWITGRAFCSTLDKRLCYTRELCSKKTGEFLFDVIPGDNWVPVLDTDNEWVEIGDSSKRTCFVHSHHYRKPSWGTSTDPRSYKGFTFCCDNNQNTVYKDIKYQYIGKTATYLSSKRHCNSQGRRLCRINEVCKQNIPAFGVVKGDMWVAVSDRDNEWVEIGDSARRTCWIHGPKYGPPDWGKRTDGKLIDYVGYVYCCQNYRKGSAVVT